MTDPRTLLIGRPRAEWSRQLARDLGPAHRLKPAWTADSITSALDLVALDTPELVVVLQETPDQFSSDSIQQLLCAWPLARLVVCHGPWCHGDGRNRSDWPHSVRVPHTTAPTRLASERLLLLDSGEGLPWTAGRDEMAAAEFASAAPPTTDTFAFCVVSPDPAWSGALTDQLVALGGQSVPWSDTAPASGIDLLLIDADPWSVHTLRPLAPLLKTAAPRLLVLLTNTPDAIPASELDSALSGHSGLMSLEVHDKLVAAARPADLLVPLATTAARRSA